jgi:hypothetical protein
MYPIWFDGFDCQTQKLAAGGGGSPAKHLENPCLIGAKGEPAGRDALGEAGFEPALACFFPVFSGEVKSRSSFNQEPEGVPGAGPWLSPVIVGKGPGSLAALTIPCEHQPARPVIKSWPRPATLKGMGKPRPESCSWGRREWPRANPSLVLAESGWNPAWGLPGCR